MGFKYWPFQKRNSENFLTNTHLIKLKRTLLKKENYKYVLVKQLRIQKIQFLRKRAFL
jgi:hypothetical protein